MTDRAERIVILGLGYVGLPLALGLARAGFWSRTYTALGGVEPVSEGREP